MSDRTRAERPLDLAFVMDPIEGVDSRNLCRSIQARGHKDVRFVDDLEGALAELSGLVCEDDVVLTLGAGNVYQVGEVFLERYDA